MSLWLIYEKQILKFVIPQIFITVFARVYHLFLILTQINPVFNFPSNSF
jgi:hypothetical protein